MSDMEIVTLSAQFRGLNRSVSPQLLPVSESPDTTDCRLTGKVMGKLGQRLGRARAGAYTYSLLGLGMLNVPFGRFNITADANGDWTAAAVAWGGVTPATPTVPTISGMDTSAGVRFLQYRNRTYAFNGRNRNRVFDGNRWTRMGIKGGVYMPNFTPTITLTGGTTLTVTNASLTSNVAELTIPAHGLTVGRNIVVNITDTIFNGTFTVTAVPSSSKIRYALTHANVALEAVVGTVTATATNGVLCTFLTIASNVATLTTATPHGFITGNSVTFTGNAKLLTDNSPFTVGTVGSSTTFQIPLTAPDVTAYPLTGQNVYVSITGSSAANAISGSYYYFVVPANSTKIDDATGRMVEGLPSEISANALPVSQSVTISSIPATHEDPQVDRWNIYRTTNGGFDSLVATQDQDFFLVGFVPLGTTTYTDTTDDSTGWYLQESNFNRMRFEQIIPATCKYMASYGDRLFMAGFDPITSGTVSASGATITLSGTTWPDGIVGCYFRKNGDDAVYVVARQTSPTVLVLDRAYVGTMSGANYTIYRNPYEIWFSEQFSPEAGGLDGEFYRNKLEVPGREAITGLCEFSDHLLVFTFKSIYVITGKGYSRFEVKMLPEPFFQGLGALNGDCVMRIDNEVHFLSTDGPARMGNGEPELYGIKLNVDWLDDLGAAEYAIACMGSDTRDVFYSVPNAAGQTLNSKTWRYERATDSWWEETEVCPYRYITQDGTDGQIAFLFYLQGHYIMRPNTTEFDLLGAGATTWLRGTVSPPSTSTTITVSENSATATTSSAHNMAVGDSFLLSNTGPIPPGLYTVTAVADATHFSFSVAIADGTYAGLRTVTPNQLSTNITATARVIQDGAGGTFSSGDLEECYARFYRAGVYVGARRIISNTSTAMTWSNTTSLPGAGTLVLFGGDTYEIGNINWKWLSRTLETPGKLSRFSGVHTTFDTKAGAAVTILKSDIVDGAESVTLNATEAQKAAKWAANRDCRDYAVRLSSRTGAVIRHVEVEMAAEADIK